MVFSTFLRLLILTFGTSSLVSCYSIKQAVHFNGLFNSREKISEVIVEQRYEARILAKLDSVNEILEFALQEGLNVGGSYAHYIHIDKKNISYTVQAAKPLEMKSKRWWFPFVGSVPYLGFFDKNERDKKADELKLRYDINKGIVGGFSSLGWFDDPILTPMLRRSKGSLAHLLFHELTHRTFWSVGSTRFNENLAEFSADIMTEKYLSQNNQTLALEKYRNGKSDKIKFKTWLGSLKTKLSELYKRKDLDQQSKLLEKERVINEFKENSPQFSSKRYDFVTKKKWNNASILAFSLYSPNTDQFMNAYHCSQAKTMGEFLQKLEDAEDETDDNFKALTYLCLANGKKGQS
ncbi:MAG: aminopeptidase [Pseudobacteriovorax sp.]|nr:aminopeptidase [Pseudobacteriovorax sp.]